MAIKPDEAAAKARKQKIILAVAGVAMVGLAVIQVPKVMGHSSSTATEPATEAATAGAPVASDAGAASTGTVAAAAVAPPPISTKPAAYVAGVALPGGTRVVRLSANQLASFTLFEAKDPFVQQVDDQAGLPDAGAAPAPGPGPEAAAQPTATAAPASPAAKAPAITDATIMFNGKPQQLTVKQKFPKGSPLFVLVALKKKQAKIGVAGGSFDNGQTVTLALGKTVTLVDTATGVRYELKLVYTGSTPEAIEGFSSPAPQADTSTVSEPAPSTGGAVATATP